MILLIKISSFTNRELNIDGNSTKGYLFLGLRYKIDANWKKLNKGNKLRGCFVNTVVVHLSKIIYKYL